MHTMYRSAKNQMFVHIDEMHTHHILNAVKKVRSGTHFFYTDEDPVLISLLIELEKRNESQLASLNKTVQELTQLRIRDTQLSLDREPVPVKPLVSRNVLGELRSIALRLIKERGLVTADTLRHEYGDHSVSAFLGRAVEDIGSALPYVFRDKRFKKIGFLRSTFGPNNGRFINVWGSAAAL